MNDLRLQLINDSIVDESLALGYLAVDYSPVLVLIVVLFLVSSNIMENKTEDVVLDEEGVGRWLQHKVLHEGLWRILQLSSLACELILSGTRLVNFQCSVHLVSVHGSLIMLGQMIIIIGE